MIGDIKLHRAITSWEWYKDSNTMRLFIHCLLKAQYKDSDLKGQKIARGSFVTGRDILSHELGLSVSKVRTSLDKLIKTNEIKVLENKALIGTILEVVNYNTYQVEPELKLVGKTMKQREIAFRDSLVPYVDKYGKTMIRAFFEYWTESKTNGKKMRFEMQKVFDIKKRLLTWSKNNFNGNNQNTITKRDDVYLQNIKKQMKNK